MTSSEPHCLGDTCPIITANISAHFHSMNGVAPLLLTLNKIACVAPSHLASASVGVETSPHTTYSEDNCGDYDSKVEYNLTLVGDSAAACRWLTGGGTT